MSRPLVRPGPLAIAFTTVAVMSVVAGCSASSNAPSAAAGGFAAPAAGQGIQLAFTATVPSGAETHHCKEFVLPSDVEVASLEHQYATGGHHLLVYRTTRTAADVTGETFDCGDVAGPVVYAVQTTHERTTWPAGVGLRFKAGEVVRLESHFLNTTAGDLVEDVKLNVGYAATPLTAEAGGLFFYDTDIAVPAHGTFTAKMHCVIPTDIDVLFLQPHVHLRGVAERITVAGQPVITSTGYGDLETRSYVNAPIHVKAGESIDYECDYANDGDDGIVAGPSKTQNEMCMILGGYYPRMDPVAEFCAVAGSGPIHAGAKTCSQALACAQQNGGNATFAGESCFVDVCPASSTALDGVTSCGFVRCPQDCPGDGCGACVQKNCPETLAACVAATCAN